MHNQDTVTGPSFSLKNRLSRVVWSVFYFLFFRFTPNPLHRWRAIVLRVFGAKVGTGVHVYPSVKIWAPWNVEFGDQCGVANGAILYSQDKIYIGQRAVISQGSHLCAGTHDFTKKGFPILTKPIYIGDYAWLAAETFVHPGVTVGEGTVIGARSVVTKDMPSWMICSGFPCIPINPRKMEDIVMHTHQAI